MPSIIDRRQLLKTVGIGALAGAGIGDGFKILCAGSQQARAGE